MRLYSCRVPAQGRDRMGNLSNQHMMTDVASVSFHLISNVNILPLKLRVGVYGIDEYCLCVEPSS
jgi:hypothetical protein